MVIIVYLNVIYRRRSNTTHLATRGLDRITLERLHVVCNKYSNRWLITASKKCGCTSVKLILQRHTNFAAFTADHCLSKMWLHQCQINFAATQKLCGVYGYFNQNKTSQQTFSAKFSQLECLEII